MHHVVSQFPSLLPAFARPFRWGHTWIEITNLAASRGNLRSIRRHLSTLMMVGLMWLTQMATASAFDAVDDSFLSFTHATGHADYTFVDNVLTNDDGVGNTVLTFTVAGDATTYDAGQTANIVGVGDVTIDSDGVFTFAPELDYAGTVPLIAYTSESGDSASTDTAMVTVTINSRPQAPLGASIIRDIPNDLPLKVELRTTETDGDTIDAFNIRHIRPSPYVGKFYKDAALTLEILSNRNDGDPTNEQNIEITDVTQSGTEFTASIYFVPDEAITDVAKIWARATDSRGAESGDISIELETVAPINSAPEFTSTPVTSATLDESYSYLITASDVDDLLTDLRFSASWEPAIPAGLTFNDNLNGTATLSGTPTSGAEGNYSIEIVVTDGFTRMTDRTQSFELTVGDPTAPPAATGGIVTGDEDEVVTIELSGTDTDGTVEKFKITELPDAAVGILYSDNPPITQIPVNHAFDAVAGTGKVDVYYKAVNDHDFNDTSFKFVAIDNDGAESTPATINIDMQAINDAPILNNLTASTDEDTPINETAATGLLLGVTDPDGDPYRITEFAVDEDDDSVDETFTVAEFGSNTATIVGVGVLEIHDDGEWSFTPEDNYNGTVPTVTFTVEDTVSPPDTGVSSATLIITVTDVDDTPIITAPSTDDDVTLTIAEDMIFVTDVDASDGDPGDVVTYEIDNTSDDADLFEIDSSTGVLSFISAPNFENPEDADLNNVYEVTVIATDGANRDVIIIHVVISDVEEIPPMVEITAPEEVRGRFIATVTFSEPVYGFIEDDLTVENATITNFAGADGDAVYEFTLDPIKMGEIELSVAAGVAEDLVQNQNEASNTLVITFIDAEEVREQTVKVTRKLLTQRNRITMDFKPSFGRRLMRMTGNYQTNGGVSAFGMTYQDGRLPAKMVFGENQFSFAYSMRQAQAAYGPPRLTGNLDVQRFGLNPMGSKIANPDKFAPPKLSHTLGKSPSELEESAAIHQYLFDREQQLKRATAERAHQDALSRQRISATPPPLPGPDRPVDGLMIATGAAPGRHSDTMTAFAPVPRSGSGAAGGGGVGPASIKDSNFETRNIVPLADIKDRLDVWMEGIYGEFEVNDNEGTFTVFHVGIDYKYTPDVLIGFSTQFDWLEADSTEDASSTEGVGFLLGPYITARLAPKLLFDGRISWGQSTNDVSPYGTYTDEVESERLLASGAFIGDVKLDDNLTLLPEARLNWYIEETEDYVDSLDVLIPSASVETGTFEFGPTLRGNFTFGGSGGGPGGEDGQGDSSGGGGAGGAGGGEGRINPFVGLKGIWTFAHDVSTDDDIETPPQSEEGMRARIDVGVDISNPNIADGLMLSISSFYDGIGDDDYEVWGGSVRVKKSF